MPIALVYMSFNLRSIFLALNTIMHCKFGIIHTPGAFGNFLGYVFDCHQQGKLLPEPFVQGGASHKQQSTSIPSFDLVVPSSRDMFQKNKFDKVIGCVWQAEDFAYILHACFGRTNGGQYNGDAVEFMQDNFYDFVKKHMIQHEGASDLDLNISLLKDFFNYEVNETNKSVPRHILRQFFWLQLFYQDTHKVCAVNDEIKNMEQVDKIHINDILDYSALQKFVANYFDHTVDFEAIHKKFVDRNISLANIRNAKTVVQAVMDNKAIEIDKMTVIAEAYVLYHLEKYYFDIPFFDMKHFPTSTAELLEHVRHYPNVMKQPNKLYAKFYKKFKKDKDVDLF